MTTATTTTKKITPIKAVGFLVHVYREPGDLNDSWDFEPIWRGNDGNEFVDRFPNAFYGTMCGRETDHDCCSRHNFFTVEEVSGWRNGHSYSKTYLLDERGGCIAAKTY